MLELAKVETPCHTSTFQANPKPGENQQPLVDCYGTIIHFNRVFHYKPSILRYHYSDKAQESKMMGKMKKPAHVSEPGESPRP